jgi:hypothetical protein
MTSSRIRFCSSILVPSKSKPMPGRQKPLATMARIAMPMSPIFTWPLTRSFTTAVPAGGGFSSRQPKYESTRKKIASNTPDANKACGHKARVAQKKSIPRRKPRNRGGSPTGVNTPPMFATRKIKKTTTWALKARALLARMVSRSGRGRWAQSRSRSWCQTRGSLC